MDEPETMIALSAVARNSGPNAQIFLWGLPQNHIQWGVVRPPHRSVSLSTAGLLNSPPSSRVRVKPVHPKI